MSSDSKPQTKSFSWFLGLLAAISLVVVFGERWLRALLLYLSGAGWARQFISSMPFAQQTAARFVAGDRIDDAIATARDLNAKGMRVTMDYLGESVTNAADSHAAREEILQLLDRIAAEGVNANVSVKLSQLGLKIDERLVLDNMRAILLRARHHHNWIRIDMEESAVVDQTLRIFRTLRDEDGFNNVGVVIQAYLYRSLADVEQLIADGVRVRLCKGAYKEPADIAYPKKSEVDANFVRLMQHMLTPEALANGMKVGVATHDEKMIAATIAHIEAVGFSKEDFEFQLLFGIRGDLQENLIDTGYNVAVYVPYGTAWYPYFMRRLAERPANLWFFLRNLIR